MVRSLGNHLWTRGGTGQGPGEFLQLDTMFVSPGDTVYAWDYRLRRGSLFDPDGGFVRTFQVRVNRHGIPQPLAVLEGGNLLVHSTISMIGRLGVDQSAPDSVAFFLVDWEGNQTAKLGILPSLDLIRYRVMGRSLIGPTYPVVGAAATATGGKVFFGRGTHPLVVVAGSERGEMEAWRLPWKLNRVRSQDYSAWVDYSVRNAQEGVDTSLWRATLQGRPFREWSGAFVRLYADPAGYLWVQRYEDPWVSRERWSVFDQTGSQLCDLLGPPNGELLQAGSDFVLVLRKDSMGVEYVALHTLERSSAAVERIPMPRGHARGTPY